MDSSTSDSPRSSDAMSDKLIKSEETRAERVARYKEERRKQLASQFAAISNPSSQPRRSSVDPPAQPIRATRTSALRAAANNQNASNEYLSGSPPSYNKPKTTNSSTTISSSTLTKGPLSEDCNNKDKSGKRKSNLNRSLASEVIPLSGENDRESTTRRRRRPQQENNNSTAISNTSNASVIKTDTSDQDKLLNLKQKVPTTISPVATLTRNSSRREKNSQPTEVLKNSRNLASSRTPSSAVAQFLTEEKTQSTKQQKEIVVLEKDPGFVNKGLRSGVEKENLAKEYKSDGNTRSTSNYKRNQQHPTETGSTRRCSSSSNSAAATRKNSVGQKNGQNVATINKRMDELTALTNETLARVERLTHRTQGSKMPASNSSPVRIASTSGPKSTQVTRRSPCNSNRASPSRTPTNANACNSPVSILKRKTSTQMLVGLENETASKSSTQPVTFSPSVVEPKETPDRKRGILKKRSSLDETQVLRHRSCSPDLNKQSGRSSGRQKRRSSLEEHFRLNDTSDASVIQGILKPSSSSKSSSDDVSFSITTTASGNSSGEQLQGILKRKSSSETSNTQSASQSTTILNLCSVLDLEHFKSECEQETCKPILKKKSFSEESNSGGSCKEQNFTTETPKPILKKKSSTETDDSEDKPKKPILKTPKVCSFDSKEDSDKPRTTLRHFSRESSTEMEPKSILKGGSSRNSSPSGSQRSGRKYSGNYSSSGESTSVVVESSSSVKRLSVSEIVGNMETLGASALEPEMSGFVCDDDAKEGAGRRVVSKRKSSARYQTQPITFSEIEQSLNLYSTTGSQQQQSKSEFANDLSDCSNRTACNTNYNSVDQESNSADNHRSATNSTSHQEQSSSKEMTDDEADPSKLSLSERVKLFNQRIIKPATVAANRRKARFQTQPVTSKEVETAARISPPRTTAADFSDNEMKGILKSSTAADLNRPTVCSVSVNAATAAGSESETPRSVLKRRKSPSSAPNGGGSKVAETLKSILKQDSGDFSDGTSGRNVRYEIQSGTESSSVFESSDVVSSSDGDSSGAQEIQRILNKDKESRYLVRQIHHAKLSKSKSHGAVEESKTSQSIAERRAALEHFGDTEWRKRQSKLNSANEELNNLVSENFSPELRTPERSATVSSILASRKEELENSAKKWKNRIEANDAVSFSVAGRMKTEFQKDLEAKHLKMLAADDNFRRTPTVRVFKGTSIEKSKTTSSMQDLESSTRQTASLQVLKTRKIQVHRPDDETFTSFYATRNNNYNVNATSSDLDLTVLQFSQDDLDSVQRVPENNFLVHKRAVKIQRKHQATSKNPVKALAARTDILTEYNEVITGVAAKELLRMNIEKLDNKSNMAMEALAGLISKEDFSSVSLKKSVATTSPYLHYKEMLLLHIKGRRHIQTRIVEPVAKNVNEGDNFILVTPTQIFNYSGKYSNVIEQSKAADVAGYVQLMGDLGCKTSKVINLSHESVPGTRDLRKFWSLLGVVQDNGDFKSALAGHPDEDEVYEASIIKTNKVYRVRDEELVPVEEYWGCPPKYEMLKSSEIFVYDFGSELYVWSGKNAIKDDKKMAYNLAKQMWTEGYNYSECLICPLNVSLKMGERPENEDTNLSEDKSAKTRPDWALFIKITQHMEPIIFKEKFLDWPDFSRNKQEEEIQEKEKVKSVEPIFTSVEPCDVHTMRLKDAPEPDLYLDGSHLGRGTEHYDDESNRLFKVTTLDTTIWHILEYSSEKLGEKSLGQFYSGDSYVIRWKYQLTVMGRELSGKPSKYGMRGRDRCAYFCWQGKNALVSEKGAAALLTVELDSENARQINVSQGAEPPAFLNLWNGQMTVHHGRRDQLEKFDYIRPRLFIARALEENETVLIEVQCKAGNLRSRTTFVLLINSNNNATNTKFILWHGAKTSQTTKRLSKVCVEKIIKSRPPEYGFDDKQNVDLEEIEEGCESAEFIHHLGGNTKKDYFSMMHDTDRDYDFTPRLFHFTSTGGSFQAVEILCPYRNIDVTNPYPFLQSDIYNVSQPALFMLDNGYELWLWQGWWPLQDNDEQAVGSIPRWQSERKAAMATVLNYWQKNKDEEEIPAYLIFAGLEPLGFTNLFPTWEHMESAASIHLQDGRKEGDMLKIQPELARLSRTTYPLEEILQRPLPEGVDPSHLEDYLTADDFQKLLYMTKTEFQKLPIWRQTSIKKEKGLF